MKEFTLQMDFKRAYPVFLAKQSVLRITLYIRSKMGKELFKLKAMAKNKGVYKLAREEKLKRLKVRRHFLTPKEQVSEKIF